MKRFWDHADIAASPAGWRILLDGKPMHLPGGSVLQVGPEALARAIAEEWQQAGGGKGGEMTFADTPLTRLAGTAQERVAPDPEPTIAALARYAETDLLCYRADAPPALVQRQARDWQPWLDWAAVTYDAPLKAAAAGVVPVRQDPRSLRALALAVAAQDPLTLAGLGLAVPALGSLVLGLALAEQRLTAEAAHELGALDELFQAELWGRDAEAEHRRAGVRDDIAIAARFIVLARG